MRSLFDQVLVDGAGKYKQFKTIEEFQKAHEWDGLVPGDLVRFRDQEYLYKGYAPGGPGVPGFIPSFISKTPDGPRLLISDEINIEGRNDNGPVLMVYGSRSEVEKIGHFTPEEWNNYVAEFSAR